MAALSYCRRSLATKILKRISCRSNRLITTSEKKTESNADCPSSEAMHKKIPDFTKPLENKDWVSFGYDYEDKDNDKFTMHLVFFCLVTLVGCGCTFIYLYRPDRDRADWARREAFIRLYEREQLGLEPIDPNYVDPSKIILPPDEELSDEDIII